jgi:hypothetical protein
MAQVETESSEMEARPVLCPHCMQANTEGADFCVKCGTPLTAHAEIDPMGRIFAQGDTFRKAVAGSPKLIVVVGMWLIFGMGLLELVLAIPLNPESRGVPGAKELVMLVMWWGILLATGIVSGLILFRTTRNYFRMKRGAEEE